MKPRVPAPLPQHAQQKTGQTAWAPNVNNLPLDKTLKLLVILVEQIMTESNGDVSDEAKILAITKIVLKLMEQNGHENP
jgi:hypothetical protein